ncbi:bifunctional 2-polyprenyl-6-hydroxyphenol methylase/3-demethylubiquinol 3-O-methyltransferase UbiG [Mycobacterium sp. 852002-40037_SCH5390672]|uniref:class I SAM-dependent methyltransferase n=1 Tax=Mycobacterium sp. 852002-40037_SCH5390672 TaxID=1834089 RepID=UPI000804ECF1|nr:class I SAM-dependent methyltransferase [Mycobacterium sp. 852002-40037_SCH5390672]OBB89816.1 SAM-dependent methyltransferase [Mycobacterium sp. 852002-40037_SCH5390672]
MDDYAKHDDYWNHNTAYHSWLVGIASRNRGDVLDVGCGEGLLAQRLAAVSRSVVGIDADPISVWRASERLQPIGNASVELLRFEDLERAERSFDLITFVASLHHLPLRDTLRKACQMLRPAGKLAVVGLSANKSVTDWVWAGLCTPAARAGSLLHRETRGIGVTVADPLESLAQIRQATKDVLPGARIRRGLYYRYRLLWHNT